MPGEMSQMITERPDAGAVRHENRCGVVRNPRDGGFVPVAHGTAPIDIAAKSWKRPHGVSPRSPDERLLPRLSLAVARLPFLPAMGSSISPWP